MNHPKHMAKKNNILQQMFEIIRQPNGRKVQ